MGGGVIILTRKIFLYKFFNKSTPVAQFIMLTGGRIVIVAYA